MRPSIASASEQLQLDSLSAASRHTTAPINNTRLHPVVRKLLLISLPTEGRRLSWPEQCSLTLFYDLTRTLYLYRSQFRLLRDQTNDRLTLVTSSVDN